MRLGSVLLFVLLTGCQTAATLTRSATRPVPALAVLRDGHGFPQSCLVIFLPGFGDDSQTFLEHGFPQHLIASGAPCDSVTVNLHFRYYSEDGIAEILNEDILAPAQARGYRHIWLVGVSMGGLGASLLAEARPNAIEGMILLSPFLGEAEVIDRIHNGGGLSEWTPPEEADLDRARYTERLWRFFRNLVSDPDSMPALYLGWADGEALSPAAELLASVLPAESVVHSEGRHAWTTWQPLFATLLRRAHPPQ